MSGIDDEKVKKATDQAAPMLLKDGQLRRRLGMGATKFRELKRAGAFDVVKAPLAGYYSAAKVERWLNGEMGEPTRRLLSSHKPKPRNAR